MKKAYGFIELGTVCEIQNGFAFDSKLFNSESKGLPLIRIRDVKRGFTETYTTEACDESYLVNDGDFLIGMDGEFNIGQWKSGKALLNQRVCKLVPSKEVLPKFIYYYIPQALKEIESKTAYTTVKHLSSKQIKSILIPDLTLDEQQTIVDFLDSSISNIEALKDRAGKLMNNAVSLFHSAITSELSAQKGWVHYCLKDVCTRFGEYGMNLPSTKFNGIRYVRITDITEFGDLNDERVSANTPKVEEKYLLADGDIVFARTGATVGKTLVYEESLGACCFAGYLIRYRPNQSIILPRILFYITHSSAYYNWVSVNQRSATLPNISAKLYNGYEFSLPSIEEQKCIIDRLDKIYEKCKVLRENYSKTSSLCDSLKESLLKRAFYDK